MMTQPFNADEVFEIAEQIERNGEKFYRRAAELALADSARKLLVELAEMEARHEKVFADMRKDLAEQHPEWSSAMPSPDGGNEAVLYLRAVAEGRVFDLKSDPAGALSGAETVESILRTAIGLEKDSVVFYVGIKSAVPEDLGRDQLDRIIREEMTHITVLSRELAAQETAGR